MSAYALCQAACVRTASVLCVYHAACALLCVRAHMRALFNALLCVRASSSMRAHWGVDCACTLLCVRTVPVCTPRCYACALLGVRAAMRERFYALLCARASMRAHCCASVDCAFALLCVRTVPVRTRCYACALGCGLCVRASMRAHCACVYTLPACALYCAFVMRARCVCHACALRVSCVCYACALRARCFVCLLFVCTAMCSYACDLCACTVRTCCLRVHGS